MWGLAPAVFRWWSVRQVRPTNNSLGRKARATAGGVCVRPSAPARLGHSGSCPLHRERGTDRIIHWPLRREPAPAFLVAMYYLDRMLLPFWIRPSTLDHVARKKKVARPAEDLTSATGRRSATPDRSGVRRGPGVHSSWLLVLLLPDFLSFSLFSDALNLGSDEASWQLFFLLSMIWTTAQPSHTHTHTRPLCDANLSMTRLRQLRTPSGRPTKPHGTPMMLR